MALSANFHFKIASVDISAAFLQSKVLDREVYVEPPSDIKKQGIVWKSNKPLYGLDKARRKFWLRIKDVTTEMGLKVMDGEEAFYFLHEEGHLRGAVLTHVDDFNLAGDDDFVEKVLQQVGENGLCPN